MVKHLIFDLDGTLVDSVGITVAIIDQMLASRGITLTACPITTRAHVSAGGEAMIAAVMGEHCEDPQADTAEFRRIHAETPTPPDTLFPHVAEVLHRLHDDGFILSICSNKPQNLCEKVLADLGIAHLFATIVGSRPGVRKKPHPDLMQLVLDATQADPADCLFIGDSELDLHAAHHFGMRFVLVEWGYVEDLDKLSQAPGDYDLVASMPALFDLALDVRRGRAAA
ncbi:MAG: HAD family hydrolase [Sandarakinorhabdus sp.]|jgi:phosphoglycolate phosphatase